MGNVVAQQPAVVVQASPVRLDQIKDKLSPIPGQEEVEGLSGFQCNRYRDRLAGRDQLICKHLARLAGGREREGGTPRRTLSAARCTLAALAVRVRGLLGQPWQERRAVEVFGKKVTFHLGGEERRGPPVGQGAPNRRRARD